MNAPIPQPAARALPGDPQLAFSAVDTAMMRDSIERFIATEVTPNLTSWNAAGMPNRDIWEKAGAAGYLGLDVPAAYGGLGLTSYEAVMMPILAFARQRAMVPDILTQSEVVIPYFSTFGTAAQKQRWLPGLVAGTTVGALALTEPDAGSDLAAMATRARKVDGGFIVKGEKTFINNGAHADLVIIAARTHPSLGIGMSLLIVETTSDGFARSAPQRKLGLHAQDTVHMYFDEVFVPDDCLIGRCDAGLGYIIESLRRERFSIGYQAVATARGIIERSTRHTRERVVSGKPLFDHQFTRFKLAELSAQIDLAEAYGQLHGDLVLTGELTDRQAAVMKWHGTETLGVVADRCLQLHGGAGYMADSEICGDFADARAARIYGGANEVMLEVIATAMKAKC